MNTKFIYISSIIVLIITAFFSTGYYHFDEHFQILEFAGLKLNMTVASNLPWEYHCQIRPAIQPAIVVLLARFFYVFGMNNPFTLTLFLRLCSASIAFTGMYLMYQTYNKTIQNHMLKNWFLLLSFFLWFMIYNNVRFSSEQWSGSIFIIAFSLLMNKPLHNRLFYLYIGLLLGLSFLFRYQIGFFIAGYILWYVVFKKDIHNTLLLLLGIIILFGIGILIDRWYYETWTLTSWNYFEQNILQNKISDFGVEPWWFYIKEAFILTIPPFGILFIGSFILFFIFKRKDVLTWTIFPFLFIHFVVEHKEIRFLFPVIGFLPIIIIKSIQIIHEKWNASFIDHKITKMFTKLFWITNVCLLILVAFKPSDMQIALYYKLYSDYKEPTTLYYVNENPYLRVLDIHFYKRAQLEIKQIPSVLQLEVENNKKQLFVTKNINAAKNIKLKKKLIYSTFPHWIKVFNFNNWIERTNCWYVYELY